MPVELRAARHRAPVDLRRLRGRAEFLLERVGRGEQVLSILLTDDREMAALHERWTGEEGPTDVLSFPMEEQGILGDIVISTETAVRQARDRARAPAGRRVGDGSAGSAAARAAGRADREILRCLVHGILHLTGHDHRTRAQKACMDRLARRLLAEALLCEGRAMTCELYRPPRAA